MWQSILLISSGAAIGATMRWALGIWLNPIFNMLAFGTLMANYLGCFIIGILTALFWQFPTFSQSAKLFLITGFLGSLTTFSSFSAEVMENLVNGKITESLWVLGLHVIGCLVCTFIGIYLIGLALK